MSKFNPEKLHVNFTGDVTAGKPIIPRYYTLTHSDFTGDLFLTIGNHYDWGAINPKRDEVLGEWVQIGSFLYYYVYLYLDQGEYSLDTTAKRNEVFRRELPLALTAIRYGDRLLFDACPILDHSLIIINFISSYPQFAKQENWGTFQQYLSR